MRNESLILKIEKGIIDYFKQLQNEGNYVVIRENNDIKCDLEFTPYDIADFIVNQRLED